MRIFKYALVIGSNTFRLPAHHKVLGIGWQGTALVLWIMVDDEILETTRTFYAAATGEKLTFKSEPLYIGTAESDFGFVAHVFQLEQI